MNPSTALATVLVDEWVRCGVREVVLCPGSRSAPLAYAVQQAEREGRLRLHVRVDERSAGFLALGLAKVSRRPAVVVTTSGTAVANLHPAVLEAHHACVPLVVLSADRPAELRGTGANQTTVQPGLFAGALRWEHDLPGWGGTGIGTVTAAVVAQEQPAWRSTVCRGWAAATGFAGDPGPVHLNVAFRDPLAPDLQEAEGLADGLHSAALPAPLAGRPGGLPWVALGATAGRLCFAPTSGAPPAPTSGAKHRAREAAWSAGEPTPGAHESTRELLVLGDLPDPADAQAVLDVAQQRGWPVIAEPFGTSDRRGVVPHGPLLLTDQAFLADHLPDRVHVVGRLTLHREIATLLRRPGVEVVQVTATSTWTDPSHVVHQVQRLDDWLDAEAQGAGPEHSPWRDAWQAAGQHLARRVAGALDDEHGERPTGSGVAAAVARTLRDGDILVLGSSNPPRDLDLVDDGSPRGIRTVVGNRGLAGIDGTVSSAVGIALSALAGSRAVALMGDLTFLHDSNGMLIGPEEPRPELTVVVVNDDGGGIFATLDYGAPQRAADFERVFATPTGADFAALCRGYAVPHRLLTGIPELVEALAETANGIRVLEVRVDRSRHRDLRDRLRRAASGPG